MDKSNYLQPREYEMLAVLLPDQGDEETQTAIDKLLGHITAQNGTIDSVSADSPWGRRRLAYTIRHEGVDYRDGHYVLAYFTAMPAAIAEIERELKLDTNVIRYLMLIHDPEMGEKFDENAVEESDEESEDTAAAVDAPAEETSEVVAEEAPAEEAPTEEVAEETATEEAAEEAATEETADEEPAAEETPAAEEATEEEAPAEGAEEADEK